MIGLPLTGGWNIRPSARQYVAHRSRHPNIAGALGCSGRVRTGPTGLPRREDHELTGSRRADLHPALVPDGP